MCLTCLKMDETDSFASSVTKEEYKIYYCFNCNEKCLTCFLHAKFTYGKQLTSLDQDEITIGAITENTNVWNYACRSISLFK